VGGWSQMGLDDQVIDPSCAGRHVPSVKPPLVWDGYVARTSYHENDATAKAISIVMAFSADAGFDSQIHVS
jgi:hypothetical protein